MIYPIETIVAGLATLDESEPVLAEAIALARRRGARLVLVHAFELPDLVWDAYARMGYVDGAGLAEYTAGIEARLTRVASLVTGVKEVRCRAIAGPPSLAIQEVAEHENASLILVGATRRGPIGRMLLGSTAQRVLRHAPAPVLVVRTPLPREPRRVLVTTDLTPASATVHEVGLDTAIALADDNLQARSLLVVWYGIALPPPLREDLLTEVAGEQLDRFLAQRRARGFPVEGAIRFGDPAREIVQEAEEWKADLLVLGTHGREGSERILLGSVAESTLRHAPCSVLVIPGRTTERMTLPVASSTRSLVQGGA